MPRHGVSLIREISRTGLQKERVKQMSTGNKRGPLLPASAARVLGLGAHLVIVLALAGPLVASADAQLREAAKATLATMKAAAREVGQAVKSARSYRIAERTTHPFELFASEEPRVDFDRQTLQQICTAAAAELFSGRQLQVPAVRIPTNAQENERQSAELAAMYPDCRREDPRDPDRLSRVPGGDWQFAAQELQRAASAAGTGLIRTEHAAFVVVPSTASATFPRRREVFVPVGEEGGCPRMIKRIGLLPRQAAPALWRSDAATGLLQLLGQPALVGVDLDPMYPDRPDARQLRDRNLRPSEFDLEVYHMYPGDGPVPGERLVRLFLPPYAPVLPPLWRSTEKQKDVYPMSLSNLNTCFIYFK